MAGILDDLSGVLETVVDKAKEYGGIAKIQALIKAEEAKKQEQYYFLGKKYYELYKDAPASDLTEITDKLVACDEKIMVLKEELKKAQDAGYTDVSDDAEEAEVTPVEEDVCEEACDAAED